ncbi:MAG: transposase [Thermodesulfobacteriota bacterium]
MIHGSITAHSTQRHPIHIIQRGNNRHICFGSDANHAAFAEWLKEYSQKYHVDVHAWVMMTNHVHLLCTPRKENGISQMTPIIGPQLLRRRFYYGLPYLHEPINQTPLY